jgi:hypothetical protein
MTLALTTDSPSAVQIPPSVAIPSLATSVSFPVTALAVTAPVTVTISASLPGLAAVPVILTVIPGAALTISGTPFSPYTMIGPGVSTTATFTLNQPAPAGGVTLALSVSSTAAKVPATLTFAPGQTAAPYSVQGNSVATATTVLLSAHYQGPLAPLGTTALTELSVAPTDTLHVTQVTWSKSTQTLSVKATSTNPAATVNVLNASGNAPLGTMSNTGGGNYTFQTTIASISAVNIKSNLGGSTGQGVTVIP